MHRSRKAWLLALSTAALACRGEGTILELDGGLVEAATGTCRLEIVDAAPGLTLGRTLTSDWEAGSCYELSVTNAGDGRVGWWVLVAIEPAEAAANDRWNHAATALGDGFEEWRGIVASNNVDLDAGAVTTVGACFVC